MDSELYMSAEEAAEALGVSITTLYTYVKRKQIRSQEIPGSRRRRYWRPDIERSLSGRSDAPTEAGWALGRDTQLTLVTTEGPFYRGQSATGLSRTHTLEQVASLLWQVDEEVAFAPHSATTPPEWPALRSTLASAPPTDRAIALFPLIERVTPRAFDLSHLGICRTGGEVLRWYAAIIAGADSVSDGPIHEQIARAVGGSAEAADLIRRVLVLVADHGFGAGTYAVRAVASTGVSPYRFVLAGLAIGAGRRTTSGTSETMGRLITEIEESSDPRSLVVARLQEGDDIPGFSSPPAYAQAGDPRARAILEAAEAHFGSHRTYQRTIAAIATVEELTGQRPGLSIANALVGRLVGLPHQGGLYLLGRCVGWIAHAIEQGQSGLSEPPTPNYQGALP